MNNQSMSFGNIKTSFVGTTELQKNGMSLDRAGERPVQAMATTECPTAMVVPSKKAIWNIDKNQFACIVSKEYKIFQHSDFIDTVSEALTSLGLKVKGQILDRGSRVYANILIDKEVGLGKEKFYLGFRIANSFDKSTSIRGDFYAVRLSCQNGMLLGQFQDASLREIHTTKKNVEQLVMKMVESAAKISPHLNVMISEAMETTFEGKLLSQIYQKLSINEKWAKELDVILERDYGKKLVYTKWELYNAITNMVTHHQRLGVSAAFYYEKKALELLQMPKAELLAPIVEVRR